MRRQLSPMGAFWRGLLAGAAGSAVQALFFKATTRIAPQPPKDAFEPAEPEQVNELPTQTVARRAARLAGRTLSDEQKQRGANFVHFGFGSLWGLGYGLARESLPVARHPLAAAAYGTLVWTVSDNVLLPAFKLGGWPRRYSWKTHAYAWGAHLVYGATVAASYELLRKVAAVPLLAGAWLLFRRRKVRRGLPRWLRRPVNPVFGAISPGLRRVAYLKAGALRV
jgi:hypothetical protein